MIKKLFLIVPFFLYGCGGTVTVKEWDYAESVCKNNEGVQSVWSQGQVKCRNGAFFNFDTKDINSSSYVK